MDFAQSPGCFDADFSGREADAMIRLLLNMFEWLHGLPIKRITACFVAAAARKPREETQRMPVHKKRTS